MKRNDWKKMMWVVMLAMVTVMGMAQGHLGHGGRGRNGGHHGYEGRDEHRRPPVIECATRDQLRMALQVIDNQSFDDKKLEIAELCVTLGRFCTDDLARMAEKFSFDDNRKKFLIYAYNYCEDPQNYYSLKDVFSFQSNFDDMMDTVQPRRR